VKIKIYTIDLRFPRWARSPLVYGGIPALLLAAGVIVHAAPVSVPNTFSAGDTLSAAKLNANFKALQDAINGHDTRLAAVEQMSAQATASSKPKHIPLQISLPSSWMSIGQITFNAPSAGTAAVNGYVFCHMSAGYGMNAVISQNMNDDGGDSLWGASYGIPTQTFDATLPLMAIFDVASSGTKTYYLNVYATGANCSGAVQVEFTASPLATN